MRPSFLIPQPRTTRSFHEGKPRNEIVFPSCSLWLLLLVRRNFFRLRVLVLNHRIQSPGVPPQSSRTEKIIICRKNQLWTVNDSGSHLRNRSVLVVSSH